MIVTESPAAFLHLSIRLLFELLVASSSSSARINYAYYFVLHFCFLLLVWVFGAALKTSLFAYTQPAVIVIFFVLFTNVQIALAFLFNAVFTTARTATVVTVVYVIIGGLLGEFLFKCAFPPAADGCR
jgi:hypothetical protein